MGQALMAGPSMDQWTVLREQANVLLKSGYLPAHVKTPEQAIAIIMTGQELGISPTRALNGITVIQGKPTLGAELMAVLIYRDHGPDALLFKETSNEHCTIAYRRKGASQGGEYTFSMADAQKAGLAGSQTWQKFPSAMLRARCISAVARFAFPDSIAGCYSPEELGATVQVIGDVVEVVALPEQAQSLQSISGNGHTPDQHGQVGPDRPVPPPVVAPTGPSGDFLRLEIPRLREEITIWHPEITLLPHTPAKLEENRARYAVLLQHIGNLPERVTEDQVARVIALGQRLDALGEKADLPADDAPRSVWYECYHLLQHAIGKAEQEIAAAPA